jgi:acyl carrier protein
MDIQTRVLRTIAEQFGLAQDRINPAEQLVADFGMDSLDGVELCMAIEDEFAIEIPDEDAEACETVQDVIDLVTKEVGRQS